jgi:hypothetical protein
MLNPEALLYDVPLLHRSVPAAAELRGITIKNKMCSETDILEPIAGLIEG